MKNLISTAPVQIVYRYVFSQVGHAQNAAKHRVDRFNESLHVIENKYKASRSDQIKIIDDYNKHLYS